MNIKNNIRVALLALAAMTATGSMVSCSDDPDAENYYTFTGEMLSDYLNNRPQYSEFKTIVERADLMDLLASYGQYTCFLPSNEAVEIFLHEKGLQSVDQLSDADCDTIARTHLVANMYSTYEMNQDRLATANMLGRYLATSQGVDADSNAVVYIEGTAHIIYEKEMPDGSIIHRNDSVENGIVQPIDMVIEKSNSYIADILRDNPRISYFYEALIATDVKEQILLVDDPTYDKFNYNNNIPYRYKSHIRQEVAWVPDTRKFGFTAFVEPDSVYEAKFQEYGISTGNGTLRALYDLACQIYDPVYPDDVNKEGHSFENLKDSINPLKRFVQYHIMTRYVPGTSDLTALIIPEMGEAFGTETKWQNAIDWYQTLLPHTMLKVEQLSTHPREDPHTNKVIPGVDIYGPDADKKNGHFINRRYEAPEWTFRGAYVDPTVETKPVHDALNGHYFYVDDLVVFSWDVQNRVQNMRIRMDFTTLFPEVMTNDMRLKGNYRADDNNNVPDDSPEPKNGKNHYFPMGYLDGVTFDDKLCALVYRRPHWEFWSWQGDEWNLFGDYDFVFRIPPVPFSGEWQMRLGFAPLETRGVMQVYFGTDPKNLQPQGIPLDMMQILNSEMYLGSRVSDDTNLSEYRRTSVEELAEEQKLLKNLGAYRGPLACYNTSGSDKSYSYGVTHMMRRILCQTNMDANQDYYIRFRVASEAKQGNNNEFMFDFFEMVPKSVYGVDGEGEMEDAL